jgi:hypothetical protein
VFFFVITLITEFSIIFSTKHNSEYDYCTSSVSKSAKQGYVKQSKPIPVIEKLQILTAKNKFSMGTKNLPIKNEQNVLNAFYFRRV